MWCYMPAQDFISWFWQGARPFCSKASRNQFHNRKEKIRLRNLEYGIRRKQSEKRNKKGRSWIWSLERIQGCKFCWNPPPSSASELASFWVGQKRHATELTKAIRKSRRNIVKNRSIFKRSKVKYSAFNSILMNNYWSLKVLSNSLSFVIEPDSLLMWSRYR